MLATLFCGLALLAAGCGSDNEGKDIPRSSVAGLETSLDSIRDRMEAGPAACKEITEGGDTNVSKVQSQIDALPSDVDKDVKSALQDSFDHLFELVRDECDKTQTDTNTTTTEETAPPATETTPPETETTQTQTTPPQTNTTPSEGGKDKNKDKNKDNSGNGGGGEAAPGGE
jgi:hypothetical protein